MDWKYDRAGNCTAEVAGGHSESVAMKELCAQVAHYILPANRDVDWQYLRVEVWSDSGQIVVFPSKNVPNYRIERAACQLIFHQLSEWFSNLSQSMDDEDLERIVRLKEQAYGDLFLEAAEDSELNGIRVLVFGPGGELLREAEL
jgi:hypothetical protein